VQANYAARRFGVRAAMPGFIARRLCPQLIFVAPNFAKYTQAAEEVIRRYIAGSASVDKEIEHPFSNIRNRTSIH
jgi:nucleotidyltransferase/DNA polymerase involved in DNA repair